MLKWDLARKNIKKNESKNKSMNPDCDIIDRNKIKILSWVGNFLCNLTIDIIESFKISRTSCFLTQPVC